MRRNRADERRMMEGVERLITSRPHAIAAARGCSHCSPPDRGRATSICIFVLAAVTAACSSDNAVLGPTRSPQEETAPVHHAVVLGDSLAVSPSPPESFPAQLQRRLDAGGYRWKIVNAGAGGEVTAGGLRRLESVLTSGTRILILELGANDGLRGVPIETIERNLAAIIARAQERNIRVLLCGMETPPAHGWDYTVDFHRLFPALAASTGYRSCRSCSRASH